MKIVEAFESQTNMRPKSSAHSHRSSAEDERVIIKDLRATKPFKKEDDRIHSFDKEKFKEWIDRHTRNILMHYPILDDAHESNESE